MWRQRPLQLQGLLALVSAPEGACALPCEAVRGAASPALAQQLVSLAGLSLRGFSSWRGPGTETAGGPADPRRTARQTSAGAHPPDVAAASSSNRYEMQPVNPVGPTRPQGRSRSHRREQQQWPPQQVASQTGQRHEAFRRYEQPEQSVPGSSSLDGGGEQQGAGSRRPMPIDQVQLYTLRGTFKVRPPPLIAAIRPLPVGLLSSVHFRRSVPAPEG